MKKIFIWSLAAIFVVGMAACKKDDPVPSSSSGDIDDIPATIPGFDENGASYALFSVSETKQVRFSRGNLQYKASTNTWRFAGHQYDFVGEGNANISSTYNGWIDLFGWGTSGWNSGAVCYQPWDTSRTPTNYLSAESFTDQYMEADWAWHNAIQNGGNRSHMWRTLSVKEWMYLIGGFANEEERPNAREKSGHAIVGNIYGTIILPDTYAFPNGITFSREREAPTYTMEEWAAMEAAGAVFIPAAGARYGNYILLTTEEYGEIGKYWTANGGLFMVLLRGYLGAGQGGTTKTPGFSVRPVLD